MREYLRRRSRGDIQFVVDSLYIHKPSWWSNPRHSSLACELHIGPWTPRWRRLRGPALATAGETVPVCAVFSRTIMEIAVVCSTDGGSPLRPRHPVPTVVANHRFNGTINSYSCRVRADPPPQSPSLLPFASRCSSARYER